MVYEALLMLQLPLHCAKTSPGQNFLSGLWRHEVKLE